MASRAVESLAARGAGNPEQLAAYIQARVRAGRRLTTDLSTPRYPVTSPNDVLISRSPTGGAAIRHRRGGALIGEVINQDGWRAVYGGNTSNPHSHQRGALAELLGLWNRGTTTLQRPAGEPLQPPPVQTPLMQQYQVPAIRALATPVTSASSGPRVTMANGNGSSDDNDNDNDNDGTDDDGLTPKGQGIKKKLLAKGWTDAKATMFAKRAQSFGGPPS